MLRPDLARFEARQTHEAWVDAEPRLRSQVIGPHFESLARTWTSRYASARTLGGRAKRVGFVQVNDPEMKQAFELDVVAEADGQASNGKPVILAIGEAKASDRPRTVADLTRLDRLRGSLAGRADMSHARLLLFGRSGFAGDLVAAARRRKDIELVDLARLYGGD